MTNWLMESCDKVDASVFSSDALVDEDNRKEFRKYLESWGKELNRFEEIFGGDNNE